MPFNIIKADGATRYELPGAGLFDMPTLGDADAASMPGLVFSGAVEGLGAFADQAAAIKTDHRLSPIGRDERLAPLQKTAVLNLASVDVTLDADERHWQKRESALLAVPKIEPGHSVAAIEAQEARAWFRGLPIAEQTEMLQRMDNEPGHELMILALLRSPIPQLEHHATFARDIWNRTQRLANPTEAMAIDQGRANLDWARRGTAHLASIALRVVGWDHLRVARTLLSSTDPSHQSAYKLFGVDVSQFERARLAVASESRQRI